ncbi:His-Xaa-Ser repeat protein HxsA2 [Achromobacter sp. Marseille-Q4962]|uniref:His-Xaa-Ser repeat protein HxsA2 n=1 Tax=Achromobacter sp. Marseille-Q4962 TaxID=2942202 RepID=UPI0033657DBC
MNHNVTALNHKFCGIERAMKRKFLVPVVSAISSLLGHQVSAAPSPTTMLNNASPETTVTGATTHQAPFSSAADTLSEFSVVDKSNEYLFLMQRSESGVLSAYHSSHRSHSSHSSHRSHYSSR